MIAHQSSWWRGFWSKSTWYSGSPSIEHACPGTMRWAATSTSSSHASEGKHDSCTNSSSSACPSTLLRREAAAANSAAVFLVCFRVRVTYHVKQTIPCRKVRAFGKLHSSALLRKVEHKNEETKFQQKVERTQHLKNQKFHEQEIVR